MSTMSTQDKARLDAKTARAIALLTEVKREAALYNDQDMMDAAQDAIDKGLTLQTLPLQSAI